MFKGGLKKYIPHIGETQSFEYSIKNRLILFKTQADIFDKICWWNSKVKIQPYGRSYFLEISKVYGERHRVCWSIIRYTISGK